MDRRLLFGTVGGALMVAGVGVLGIEALHLPKVAVVVVLGVLFVVGGWLTTAALFAFPPTRPAPPEAHAEHVRRLVELAASGGQFESGSSERRMLNAHDPRISRTHEAVEDRLRHRPARGSTHAGGHYGRRPAVRRTALGAWRHPRGGQTAPTRSDDAGGADRWCVCARSRSVHQRQASPASQLGFPYRLVGDRI